MYITVVGADGCRPLAMLADVYQCCCLLLSVCLYRFSRHFPCCKSWWIKNVILNLNLVSLAARVAVLGFCVGLESSPVVVVIIVIFTVIYHQHYRSGRSWINFHKHVTAKSPHDHHHRHQHPYCLSFFFFLPSFLPLFFHYFLRCCFITTLDPGWSYVRASRAVALTAECIVRLVHLIDKKDRRHNNGKDCKAL